MHTIRQVVDIVSKYAGGALPEPAKTRVRGFILTLPQRWATKAGVTGSGGMTGGGGSERDSTVTAAASGTGATRRPGGQRRAALRERGASNLDGGGGGGMRSGASSRASSPSSSPRVSRGGGSVNSHLRHNSGGGEMLSEGGGENGRVSAGTALLAAQRILVLATESLDMMRNVTGVMKDSLDRAEAYVFFLCFFSYVFDCVFFIPDGSVVYGQLVSNEVHKKTLILIFHIVAIDGVVIIVVIKVHLNSMNVMII